MSIRLAETRSRHGWLAAAPALVLALGLAACSSSSENAFIDPTVPADQLYNEALANIDAGDSSEAQKKLEKLDRQHPYSRFARNSGVMSTYLAYRGGNYKDAIQRGNRFLQLYPAHEEAPYVLYLIGMSNYRQIVDITRDQAAARKTYESMNRLVERYPESEYAEDARTKMRVARDQLAGKEMLVGRYYQERTEHLAAINRFRTVVEKYEDTRHVEEALARLTESYYALGLTSEAQTAAAVLGHNYPDSKWYRDSYALLEKGGLRPLDSGGSWLSRAARSIVGAG